MMWRRFWSPMAILGVQVGLSTSFPTVADVETEHEQSASIPRIDASLLGLAGLDSTTKNESLATSIIAESSRLLFQHGAVVLEHLVDPSVMDQLQADLAKAEGTFYGTKGSFAGEQTTRNAAKCLGESPVAQDLAMHDVTVQIVKNLLEPYTKRIVLGTSSAISVMGPPAPDVAPAPAQVIHRDDSMWGGDWITNLACTNPLVEDEKSRFPHLSVSVMWAASDFTTDNGATRVAVNSHRQCPRTKVPPPDTTYVQTTMPQGSVLLWLGGTFHGAAAARPVPRQPRHGLLFIYNLGMLRSEHNFFNAIPHDIIMGFDDQLLDLLGYYGENAVEHPWYVGPVYTQPYLGGPEGASAGGEGVQFVPDDSDTPL